jgi:hypothetical protein
LYFVDFSECSSTSAPTLNSCIGGVIIAIIIIKIDIIIKMIVITIRRRQTGADAAGGTKQRDRCER